MTTGEVSAGSGLDGEMMCAPLPLISNSMVSNPSAGLFTLKMAARNDPAPESLVLVTVFVVVVGTAHGCPAAAAHIDGVAATVPEAAMTAAMMAEWRRLILRFMALLDYWFDARAIGRVTTSTQSGLRSVLPIWSDWVPR